MGVPQRTVDRRRYRRLWPAGSPRPFLIDAKFFEACYEVPWRYLPKGNRARGFFGKGKTRQYLHRFVLSLAGKHYPEVTFSNGDWHDCRLENLISYRHEEHGAQRTLFKNSTSKRKGVSWHARRGKYAAMIRIRGKLKHLGYYADADQAARVYAIAWNEAHPHLEQLPVAGVHR